jgi:hypothetical protein
MNLQQEARIEGQDGLADALGIGLGIGSESVGVSKVLDW